MTRTTLILIAAAGSAALLLGAFGFQHLGALAPCKLCLWQRWPHAVAVALGALALLLAGTGQRVIALLGAVAAFTTAGIGLYHVGVEQSWWEGPNTCTSAPVGTLSTDQLLDQIMTAPLVRCDEIAWSFAGLSMAGWNMVIAFGLGLVWLAAARQRDA
ncbi:disulfide bond formation protein B [Pseudaestuariivita atlantica]|uniref:Dihydroneopterin aldolase n=1 Tax=Pseudaestuariivita atlantica TaxID=1317121 RepID=A0A0L1JM22_9RHOB|nr:disulfide bond formation protein B [Pseudaestuariivita atlantica]KNG92805.1 dihydroneopterin aldolase [Pseudaestuariivita atlantica]